MSRLRALLAWPLLVAELVLNFVRHVFGWLRPTENQIHVINFLVVGASTFFLFGTIAMFMPNMPLSIRLMITVIIGGLEFMSLEHVARVLRGSEVSGVLSLDLGRFDRRFVAMTLVLLISAALNIMGSYVDVHHRLAGEEATAEFEDHEAQDVHEAALAEAYPDLQTVRDALAAAERSYRGAEDLARRGLAQQEGEWAQSFYGVNAGEGPRHEALGRIADAAAARADRAAGDRELFSTKLSALQDAYAAGTTPVERDVLRQRAYDDIRARFDGFPVPAGDFASRMQETVREIHTVPGGQESLLPGLEDVAMMTLTLTGLSAGPRIPDRDLSRRTVVGSLSAHIRYAWHDLLRGGTEAWIAAGVALVLDGSVLLLSMAWYAFFLLPWLAGMVIWDFLSVTITAIARVAGTVVGRSFMLPSEVAVVGATESRQAWRGARQGWDMRSQESLPPAEEIVDEVVRSADPGRALRIVRVFARARFEADIQELGGPGFVVTEADLDGLVQDDSLVWNALVTELLIHGGEPALLRLRQTGEGMAYLFRPEVISAAKRRLDELDQQEPPSMSESMRRTLDRYREGFSNADA